MNKVITKDFYLSNDVVTIAKKLLGKVIYTSINGEVTSGIISETEAYAGVTDKGSHAYGNRRTTRTEIMFAEGGLAYIYLCYGIHCLFNIVTSAKDEPNAVLIRGIIPNEGRLIMANRKSKSEITSKHASGPGNVTKVLGIHMNHNKLPLFIGKKDERDCIWIEDKGLVIQDTDFVEGPRIGIDYAGEDAKLPYRFLLKQEVIGKYFKSI